jgi:hypothetical protein
MFAESAVDTVEYAKGVCIGKTQKSSDSFGEVLRRRFSGKLNAYSQVWTLTGILIPCREVVGGRGW